jgi:MFS transporter, FHS family, L-fucose permease
MRIEKSISKGSSIECLGGIFIFEDFIYICLNYSSPLAIGSHQQSSIMHTKQASSSSNYLSSMIIIGFLFFIFGFVTWLNGILIPFLKKSCELNDMQAYFVATAFFAAYFFLALPSSWILDKIGTKKGMSVGLVIMAIGCLVFVYAGGQRSYPFFLGGLFIVGMGLALLQTASNPYISLLGPIESAAKRISIMGICNKVAGIIGTYLLGSILLKDADQLQSQIDAAANPTVKAQLLNDLASRVETPYLIMASILMIVAVIIYFSKLQDAQLVSEGNDQETAISKGKSSVFQFPHVLLGALAIFVYVGAEVMAGDVIVIYGKNLGFSEDTSKFFGIFGLIGLLVGYIVSIALIPTYVSQSKWLSVSAIMGIILAIATYLTSGSVAVGCIAALGFSNAVMWPALFPLGIRDVGSRFSNIASALLVMGIVGGAVIPPLYGWLYKDGNPFGLDFKSAFLIIMVICYVYIYWYGKKGHKIGFAE